MEVLDGDEVRQALESRPELQPGDCDTNVRRIAYVAKLLARHGVIVITAAISPYRDARAWAKAGNSGFR